MSKDSELLTSALLSVQRALWGEVSPLLRTVTVECSEDKIIVRAYFDKEITAEDYESIEFADGEVTADFVDTHVVDFQAIRYDAPQPLNDLPGYIVYRRRER